MIAQKKPGNAIWWIIGLFALIIYFGRGVIKMNWWIYVVIALVLIVIISGLRLVFEYQRLVRFRLGKYKDIMKPGLKWIIPIIDTTRRIDLRVTTVDVEPQEAITADNVPLKVNAVIFFKVKDPSKAVLEIENYVVGVAHFARAALRDAVGKADLDAILSKREKVADEIQSIIDKATDPWGVDVTEVKIQEIELPETMKRAMAAQAEAEREKRAIIIKSEGEIKAAESFASAAKILGKEPMSLNLRQLSTIQDIASDPSQKIVFIPTDVMSFLGGKKK